MTDTNPHPSPVKPWPLGGGVDDLVDAERIGPAIRDAILEGHPRPEAMRLLDRIGEQPALTTLSDLTLPGDRVGVVLDGTTVATFPAHRIAGVEPDRVLDLVDSALCKLEEAHGEDLDPLREAIAAGEAPVRTSAPPASDWVEVRAGGRLIAQAHRCHLVEGWPADDAPEPDA